MGGFASIAGNCLLFCLVFGMSATVDSRQLERQLRNKKAILTVVGMQFVVLPFIGFLVIQCAKVDFAIGVTLLIITTSPGGSYSNWWVSLFNGDLALSVSTTAVSTIVSVVMLPLNIYIYSTLTFNDNVAISYVSLFQSLSAIMLAIGLGLFVSMNEDSHNFNVYANKLGNVAGISLIIFSAILSNSGDAKIWQHSPSFYFVVATPCTLGLILANLMAFRLVKEKPELVTISIESCYQNVGIATSVALSMFQDDDLAEAMSVPLFYGFVEAIILGIYCMISWKLDWTKAPSTDPFLTVISVSYEVLLAEEQEKNLSIDSELTKDIEFAIQKPKTSSDINVANRESNCTYTNFKEEDQSGLGFRVKKLCVGITKWGEPFMNMCDSILLSMESLKDNVIGQQPELESQPNGILV